MSKHPAPKAASFLVNINYEKVIADGAPLMWSRELPPRNPGNDAMLRRAYELGRYDNVLVEVPNGAVIERVENADAGSYAHVQIHGIDVHLRGGLELATKPGHVLKANVRVYVVVWEPKGARERGCASNGKDAFANYALAIDLTPADNADNLANRRLVIVDTSVDGYNRGSRDRIDPRGGVFCHLSREEKKGRRNQHIEVRALSKAQEAVTTPVLAIAPADLNQDDGSPGFEKKSDDARITLRGTPVSIGKGALAEQVSKLILESRPETQTTN